MKIVILSGICIVHNNKTLLLQQSKASRHPGKWGHPGGHRKKNETLTETALREVKEETNLDVKIKGLIQGGIRINSRNSLSLLVVYYSTVNNLKKLSIRNPEISRYVWVGIDEVKGNEFPLRNPLLKPILIQALQHKYYPIDIFKIYSIEDFYL